jgi:hypothetical protein
MGQDKYLIEFDWRNMRGCYPFCANCKGGNDKNGVCINCTPANQYSFHQNWSTNSFIKFLFKFIVISLKYEIVDVQYRNCKE